MKRRLYFLMPDALYARELVHRRHPEAAAGGVGWSIAALPV